MGVKSTFQESGMEIRIGIVQSMKEIDVELPEDADREKVMKEVEAALTGRRQGPLAHRSQGSPRRRTRRAHCLRGVRHSGE